MSVGWRDGGERWRERWREGGREGGRKGSVQLRSSNELSAFLLPSSFFLHSSFSFPLPSSLPLLHPLAVLFITDDSLLRTFARYLPDLRATFSIFDQPQIYLSWARKSSLIELGLQGKRE